MTEASAPHYDVIILGAGLAGLTLSRQLLLESDKRILVLDKSQEIPTARQKYGESSVQVGGYYFAKVLDLEQYLWHEHFMKYNLRFYFKTSGRKNCRFEDYGQTYIRKFSNIPCYQLDRNRFEVDLLRRNQADPRFTLLAPTTNIRIALADQGRHTVDYCHDDRQITEQTDWIIDTTGRSRLIARQMELREATPINHGASFMWVEGTVDIEKLTDSQPRDIRLNKNRRVTGHTPHWLATNHFMGEGFWFWVIPLRKMTSLGLVYDNQLLDGRQFASADSLRDWVCEEFPLFARDLPRRRVIDFNTLKNFAHGCTQTINASRWAMSGESGRFTDPLYSPGSDFIALHNTLTVDAILCSDRRKLARKCWLAEMMMQSYYSSLIPTFATSYDALGDQETFVLKYTWELSIYFGFFVFPFINDLVVNDRFIPGFLRRFSKLGDINQNVQSLISGYYQWKKTHDTAVSQPILHDLTALEPLCRAEETFYRVGLTAKEALDVIDSQLTNLTELARFIAAYIHATVLGDPRALRNRSLVESIDLKTLSFDLSRMRQLWDLHRGCQDEYRWSFDPSGLHVFQTTRDREDHSVAEEKVGS